MSTALTKRIEEDNNFQSYFSNITNQGQTVCFVSMQDNSQLLSLVFPVHYFHIKNTTTSDKRHTLDH